MCRKFLVCPKPCLTLSLTSLRSHSNPLQLAFEGLAALTFLFFLKLQSFALLLKPRRIITFPWYALSTVELKNPASHIVQEVSIMSDSYNSTLVLAQVLLQPLYRLRIKVIGRLVQQKNVWLAKKQTAQCNTSSLASRKSANRSIRRRTIECIHCPFKHRIHLPSVTMIYPLCEFPLTLNQSRHLVIAHRLAEPHVHLLILFEKVHSFLNTLTYDFYDRFGWIKLRFLFKISHCISRTPHHLASVLRFDTGDDFHEG